MSGNLTAGRELAEKNLVRDNCLNFTSEATVVFSSIVAAQFRLCIFTLCIVLCYYIVITVVFRYHTVSVHDVGTG